VDGEASVVGLCDADRLAVHRLAEEDQPGQRRRRW
jgi:hypothetical protein